MNLAVQIEPPRRSSARRSPTAGNRGQGSKWLSKVTRRRIYERDGWRCVWCHAKVEQPTLPEDGILVSGGIIRQASIDHVVPRSRGGSNSPSNLITCCAQCNAKRGHRSVPAFAAMIAETHGCGCGECLVRAPDVIVRRVRAAKKRNLPLPRIEA